jgi:hypothetical protein
MNAKETLTKVGLVVIGLAVGKALAGFLKSAGVKILA